MGKVPEAIRELKYSIGEQHKLKVYYFYDLGRAYYGAGQYESSK